MKRGVWGYFLVFAGLLFLAFPYSLTGAVIGTAYKGTGITAGLIFIIGGISLIISNLDDRITVYSRNGVGGREQHFMKDPTLTFGKYELTLEEFQRGIKGLENDRALIGVLRETYVPQLQEIADGPKRELAKRFLEVLGIVEKPKYEMTKDERRRIKEAFTDWRGKLSSKQKRVLEMYGIRHEMGSKHAKFLLGRAFAPASLTPSDVKAGYRVSQDIIRLIEENYKTKEPE